MPKLTTLKLNLCFEIAIFTLPSQFLIKNSYNSCPSILYCLKRFLTLHPSQSSSSQFGNSSKSLPFRKLNCNSLQQQVTWKNGSLISSDNYLSKTFSQILERNSLRAFASQISTYAHENILWIDMLGGLYCNDEFNYGVTYDLDHTIQKV